VTATAAANRWQQRPAMGHNAYMIGDNLAYATPKNMRDQTFQETKWVLNLA
jgi:hypothetical protein